MILFFHMAEVPLWVKRIQPTVITVPLTPYATNGELFSNEGEMERFFSETWQSWREVPAEYDTPPHVFIMDFTGVRTLKPISAAVGFSFVLSCIVSGSRHTYFAFDNLGFEGKDNPWQSLSSALEHGRGNRVAIARKEGDEGYQLIGDHRITEGRHWQHIFSRLATARDWVASQDFIRDGLDLPLSPITLRNAFRSMSRGGLILHQSHGSRAYLRSLV